MAGEQNETSTFARNRMRFARLSFRALPLAKQLTMASLALLLCFALTDLVLVRSLPRLELSFGYRWEVAVGAAWLFRLVFVMVVAAVLGLPRMWRRWRGLPLSPVSVRGVLLFTLVLNLAFSVAQVDAYMVEPFWLETTPVELTTARLNPSAPPLRIVHLSDIHIERNTRREEELVKRVNSLEPDLILMTGDYLNISYMRDETTRDDFRWLVGQLKARYGIYAVRGSVEPSREQMAWLVGGTQVHWLENEYVILDLNGQQIALVGVAITHKLHVDLPRFERAMSGLSPDIFTILLYHSPDLIESLGDHRVDLYLGGHTHGGQLRLPFYGALVTGSIYAKKYEAGLYRRGDTVMYISRGIGMEGNYAPRARFLCHPEIVYLTLRGLS